MIFAFFCAIKAELAKSKQSKTAAKAVFFIMEGTSERTVVVYFFAQHVLVAAADVADAGKTEFYADAAVVVERVIVEGIDVFEVPLCQQPHAPAAALVFQAHQDVQAPVVAHVVLPRTEKVPSFAERLTEVKVYLSNFITAVMVGEVQSAVAGAHQRQTAIVVLAAVEVPYRTPAPLESESCRSC